MSLRTAIKNGLLPSKPRFCRFPFGISAGITMRIDFAHQTRLLLGLYEIEIAHHCRRLLKHCKSGFDIGANAGYYSLILAKHTKGPVIAVEPEIWGIEEMRLNFEQNNYPLTCVQALVGARLEIGMVTLDHLAAEHFKPDFIKMDIEGGEADALKGGLRLIEEHRPHMVIEVHSEALEAECREILSTFDYTIMGVSPRKWLPEERVDAYNGWIICEGTPTHS